MDTSAFSTVELFAGLPQDELAGLAAAMRSEEHPIGHVLIEEGDPPSKFFVLLSGHVTVHRGGAHVVDLGPGDFFGEVGVLELEHRNASVIATTPVTVALAFGWDLRDHLERLPDLRARLEQAATERSAG